MDQIEIKIIKPETYYSESVYLDDNYILTAPETPITNNVIEKLKKWKYKKVFSSGQIVKKPSMGEKSELQTGTLNDNAVTEQEKSETKIFFAEICNFLEQTFNTYKKSEIVNYNHLLEQVKKIIPFVREKKDFILDMSNLPITEHNYLISHSVKTTIICIAMAGLLKLTTFKVIELGVAAMIHKIGMLKLPESIITSSDSLKEKEWKAINIYPLLSYRILKEAKFPSTIYLAVVESQERNNGTGYPRQLSGDKISLYGKILAIASSYCAAIAKRPFKQGKNAHSGIMDISSEMGKQYDEKLVKILILTLSFYPIGTNVLLSNNATAVVVKTTENPKEPIIRVLTTEEGYKISDNVIIDLSQNEKIIISRALTAAEIVKIKTAKGKKEDNNRDTLPMQK